MQKGQKVEIEAVSSLSRKETRRLRSGADRGIFAQCEVSATPGDAEILTVIAGEMEGNDFLKLTKVRHATMEILPTRIFNRRNFCQAPIFAVWQLESVGARLFFGCAALFRAAFCSPE